MHIVMDGDAKDNNETTMENGYWVEWKRICIHRWQALKGMDFALSFPFLRLCFYFGIVRLLFWACM